MMAGLFTVMSYKIPTDTQAKFADLAAKIQTSHAACTESIKQAIEKHRANMQLIDDEVRDTWNEVRQIIDAPDDSSLVICGDFSEVSLIEENNRHVIAGFALYSSNEDLLSIPGDDPDSDICADFDDSAILDKMLSFFKDSK